MSGGGDIYRAARENLVRVLRALQVYGPDAIVVVGGQAVYLQCGHDDLPFAPFTLDSDIAVDPRALARVPAIRRVLEEQGYRLRDGQPGLYRAPPIGGVPATGSAVDILVPEEFAFGRGSRDARLPGDNERAARRTAGLEASLYDKELRAIVAPGDGSIIDSYVAGPAALIIAKAEKISERTDDRVKPKDAADVFRLLRAHERDHIEAAFQRTSRGRGNYRPRSTRPSGNPRRFCFRVQRTVAVCSTPH